MDNEHGNDMEKNSSQTGKDTASTGQEEITSGRKADSQEQTPEKKPGAILAAKRIEAGISEEQIAARLKMTLRQLHYLETDDYEALHGIAISRGFVRAYARVLQIDPEPLVARFSDGKTSASAVSAKVSAQRSGQPFVRNQMPFRKRQNWTGKFIILLVVVIVAVIVAWNMKLFSFDGRFGKKETAETTVSAEVPSSRENKPVAPVREADNADAALQGSGEKQTVQPVGADSGSTATGGPVPATSQPVTTGDNRAVPVSAIAETEKDVSPATGTKPSLLTLDFREKSWVQVQKKDGSVITEYMGKPGEQRRLEIGEPVTVIVGYAPGVRMEFRGAPVDLASSTINSVARVNLK